MKQIIRPLWSYRIESTEKWLSEQAEKGWQLTSLNPLTRQFTFEQSSPVQEIYWIGRNKKTSLGFDRLRQHGWTKRAEQKGWSILSAEEPTLYPVRDELLHRNQLHLYGWLTVILFHLLTFMPVFLGFSMATGGNSFSIQEMLLPISTVVLDVLLLIGLYQLYRVHTRFQKREMGMDVKNHHDGKKLYKIRLGWMYNLKGTEKWLEKMASEGYIVQKVYPVIFVFKKEQPQLRAFQCTFEYKVKTSYFSMHKEMGWLLHFTSKLSFMNYSIWSMAYEAGEEKPAISYVKEEKLQDLKRAFRFHAGLAVYLILMLSFTIYINLFTSESFWEWSYGGIMRVVLSILFLFWIGNLVKMVWGYKVQKRELTD